MKAITTGHRPKSMGIPNPYSKKVEKALKQCAIAYLEKLEPDEVIAGGALGWDMAVGEAATDLGIDLTLILPFKSQGSNWPQHSQDRLESLKSEAKKVIIATKGGYSRQSMMRRNSKMLELAEPNVDCILALWNNKRTGGTWDFIQKVMTEEQLKIINVWKSFRILI